MTEEQIERMAENAIDNLDARYMAGKISTPDYDAEIAIIDRWATQQYARNFGA